MSKVDKLLEKMRNNPKGDFTIEHFKTIAKAHEVDWRQPGTSHCTFRKARGKMITIPAHKPIKAIYVKNFVRFIES